MRAIDGARLCTLHRALAQVKDFSIALSAGLADFDWRSLIIYRFAVAHYVSAGEYPTPVDALELPYCGLIVLHLDDPAPAIREAARTIQRCKPVLLVECKARDGSNGDPGPIVSQLGAREVYRAGPDRIYGWAR